MRVMCINDDGWLEQDRKMFFSLIKLPDKPCEGPKYGDVVNVIGKFYYNGKAYYNLLEWPPSDDEDGFCADEFIIISEDEIFLEWNLKKESK